ncbi:MAG TPA: arylsulfatase [Longimicrobiales bacterium]|nr:arylsulfatase [Longimicrobiales bacterium]
MPRLAVRPRSLVPVASALTLAAALTAGQPGDAPVPGTREAPDDRPSILLIVADDLGYADLGAYGSDIRTPNIDRLAAEGLRFTHFHTAPMCAPTRAMLLTGNNNHVAGMGRQSPPPELARIPGYEGYLSDRVAPFPRLLREAGYHTYSTGKWHLGNAREQSPLAAGFERSYQLTHGAANHFNSVGFFDGGSLYRADGEEVEYPAGTYTTELFTDRLIEFIDSHVDDGRPFFAFAAYTSPHWPLQVPDEWLDRYRGSYDNGYDALRERNFEALQGAGILPPDSRLPPRNDAIVPWIELGPEERRIEARKMELYAAMVENLDHHVGRLISHLKTRGLYENTLIVFMSDNGAGAEDFYHTGPFVEYVRTNYDNSYENMGRPDSWVSYGPQWAEAGSAPFSRYKTYTRQGGIAAQMIIAGPGVIHRGALSRAYVTVMDLAPTFLELGDATYPGDGSVRPMEGESLAPLLAGVAPTVHDSSYVTTLFHAGRAFIRRGPWKLSNLEPPFDETAFELFDVAADPGETTNLTDAHPQVFREMLELWRSERKRLGIVLPGESRPDGAAPPPSR